MLGRVVRRDILSGGLEQSRMRYHWGMGNRLHRKVNERTGETFLFDYAPLARRVFKLSIMKS